MQQPEETSITVIPLGCFLWFMDDDLRGEVIYPRPHSWEPSASQDGAAAWKPRTLSPQPMPCAPLICCPWPPPPSRHPLLGAPPLPALHPPYPGGSLSPSCPGSEPLPELWPPLTVPGDLQRLTCVSMAWSLEWGRAPRGPKHGQVCVASIRRTHCPFLRAPLVLVVSHEGFVHCGSEREVSSGPLREKEGPPLLGSPSQLCFEHRRGQAGIWGNRERPSSSLLKPRPSPSRQL